MISLHPTSFLRNHLGGHESLQAAADIRRCHHPRLQWAEHGRHGPTHICCSRRGIQADGQVGLPLILPMLLHLLGPHGGRETAGPVSLKVTLRDFPDGPVVKNLPCNAGDVGMIPGLGPRHVAEQLSSLLQLGSPCTTKILHAVPKTNS